MTVRTAGEFVSSGPAVGRWLVSALAVVLAHGFVIFALLPRVDEADPDAGSPAIYIELAPVTAAPEMTPADLPPGPPEQEQRDRIDASVQPKPQEKPVTEAQQTPDSPESPPAPRPRKDEPETTPQQAPSEASTAMAPPDAAVQAETAAAPAPGRQARSASATDLRWQRELVARLERSKHYPRAASGRSGVASLWFRIDHGGRLLDSHIVKSSGSAALDAETLATVRRAAPFPPPPDDFVNKQLSFVVPIRYAASSRR